MKKEYDDREYGRQVPTQPGGASPQPPVRPRQSATAPCRLGPAKPGGNPARNLNPYGGKK